MSDREERQAAGRPGPDGHPASMGDEQRLCFVIMPFGGLFDDYYREVIAPSVERAGLVARRSDEIHSHQRRVVEEIRHLVEEASICVADVTEQSPNVFYELGMAHGLDRPVVLLAQSPEHVPAELKDRRILWYRPETVNWARELGEQLTDSLRTTLEDSAAAVPPAARRPSPAGLAASPGELSLEEGEALFRDLVLDGLSPPVIERLLTDAGLPPSWVRLRLHRLSRPGW